MTNRVNDAIKQGRGILNSPTESKYLENLDSTKNKPWLSSKWVVIDDVVAVFVDLKSSSSFGINRYTINTASIYEATTGVIVKFAKSEPYSANYVQIQGDGILMLLWGERSYERALCLSISIREYSKELLESRSASMLKNKDFPDTGYRVGISAGKTIVKSVEGTPVWAGRTVNYAVKAAQSLERDLAIAITRRVWERINFNDYLTFSCGCDGNNGKSYPAKLWDRMTIPLIKRDRGDRGMRLNAIWCSIHGDIYEKLILAGKAKRKELSITPENLKESDKMKNSELHGERQKDLYWVTYAI